MKKDINRKKIWTWIQAEYF